MNSYLVVEIASPFLQLGRQMMVDSTTKVLNVDVGRIVKLSIYGNVDKNTDISKKRLKI